MKVVLTPYENFLAQSGEDTVVMTAENRAAIRNLPDVLGPRFLDVGIAEQTLIGMAAGLALRGKRPVAHALASFLVFRAYEFIRDDLCIADLPVKLVGGVPGFLSDGNGPTHQAIEDVALMRMLPNMRVYCPADEPALIEGLSVLMNDPHPCYIRYYAGPRVVERTAPFELGKAAQLSDGRHVTLLTYGFLVREAADARRRLEARGITVRLVDVQMLKPFDEAAVLAAAADTQLLVTLEDHLAVGGLASLVAETLVRHQARARTLTLALDDRWFRPALLPDVLAVEGFTGEAIARRIEEVLS